jgi:hypothetical protein
VRITDQGAPVTSSILDPNILLNNNITTITIILITYIPYDMEQNPSLEIHSF